jgi:hypothetical protein
MFEIKLPNLAERIVNRSDRFKVNSSKDYINRNKELIYETWKVTNWAANLDFKSRIFNIVLPRLANLSEIAFIFSGNHEFCNILPILAPSTVLFLALNQQREVMKDYKQLTNSLADEHLLGLNEDSDGSAEICFGCRYYSHTTRELQCAVKPYIFNTPEALDCKDHPTNLYLYN